MAAVAVAFALAAGVLWVVAGTRASVPAWRVWTGGGGAWAWFVKVESGTLALHRQVATVGPAQAVQVEGAVPTPMADASVVPDARRFNAMTFGGGATVSIAGPPPDLKMVKWWPSHGRVTNARLNTLVRTADGPGMAMVQFETFVTAVPLWMVIVALLLLAVGLWWSAARARRRSREGFCPQCEYDLRATPGQCPECGWVPA